eukprot:scaffold1307_cov200-Pinguiococcus_pyrenoidosus.AAC.50
MARARAGPAIDWMKASDVEADEAGKVEAGGSEGRNAGHAFCGGACPVSSVLRSALICAANHLYNGPNDRIPSLRCVSPLLGVRPRCRPHPWQRSFSKRYAN